jgi:protease I
MQKLQNLKVAVLATDGVEEPEITQPMKELRDAGATVHVISEKKGRIQALRHMEKGIEIPVDFTFDEANPDDYDALLLPGGAMNADRLRTIPKAKAFAENIDRNQKPIGVICHAPWLLISANLVKNRRLTSYYTIQDDIRNAGGIWSDQEVIEDGNWISSRQPSDIPVFNSKLTDLIGSRKKTKAA